MSAQPWWPTCLKGQHATHGEPQHGACTIGKEIQQAFDCYLARLEALQSHVCMMVSTPWCMGQPSRLAASPGHNLALRWPQTILKTPTDSSRREQRAGGRRASWIVRLAADILGERWQHGVLVCKLTQLDSHAESQHGACTIGSQI